jgi:hypothetical protein
VNEGKLIEIIILGSIYPVPFRKGNEVVEDQNNIELGNFLRLFDVVPCF